MEEFQQARELPCLPAELLFLVYDMFMSHITIEASEGPRDAL